MLSDSGLKAVGIVIDMHTMLVGQHAGEEWAISKLEDYVQQWPSKGGMLKKELFNSCCHEKRRSAQQSFSEDQGDRATDGCPYNPRWPLAARQQTEHRSERVGETGQADRLH